MLYLGVECEKRSVLLQCSTQRGVPQFGGRWQRSCTWYEPVHLTRPGMNDESLHCEGPHSTACDQSFLGGMGERREMGALAALSPSGAGSQCGRAPMRWWDSTCSCGEVAQQRWASWGKGGLVCFSVRWQPLARLARATTGVSGSVLGVLPPTLKSAPIWWWGTLSCQWFFYHRFFFPPSWEEKRCATVGSLKWCKTPSVDLGSAHGGVDQLTMPWRGGFAWPGVVERRCCPGDWCVQCQQAVPRTWLDYYGFPLQF